MLYRRETHVASGVAVTRAEAIAAAKLRRDAAELEERADTILRTCAAMQAEVGRLYARAALLREQAR